MIKENGYSGGVVLAPLFGGEVKERGSTGLYFTEEFLIAPIHHLYSPLIGCSIASFHNSSMAYYHS